MTATTTIAKDDVVVVVQLEIHSWMQTEMRYTDIVGDGVVENLVRKVKIKK